MKPRVLVNGLGTIGKRVAHAVLLQDDMKLVGVATLRPNFVVANVMSKHGPLSNVDLYASDPSYISAFENAGFKVKGTLTELLENGKVDVVIDCTPGGVGEQNKQQIYEKYKVNVIFEGGEKARVAEMTFNSFVNFEQAKGKRYIRVPSCNTTSLIRTLHALDERFGIESVFAALVRRAEDPHNPSEGPINATVPDAHVPSHHGPDVKTVMPNLNIVTMAVKVPVTLAHVHMLSVKLKQPVEKKDVIQAFEETPRIALFRIGDGYTSTAEVIEFFRDILRPRYDMYEVVVWEDLLNVEGNNVYWSHMVHQEAIVIPENIDCVRAMFGITDKWTSIKKTDKSLGMIK